MHVHNEAIEINPATQVRGRLLRYIAHCVPTLPLPRPGLSCCWCVSHPQFPGFLGPLHSHLHSLAGSIGGSASGGISHYF